MYVFINTYITRNKHISRSESNRQRYSAKNMTKNEPKRIQRNESMLRLRLRLDICECLRAPTHKRVQLFRNNNMHTANNTYLRLACKCVTQVCAFKRGCMLICNVRESGVSFVDVGLQFEYLALHSGVSVVVVSKVMQLNVDAFAFVLTST